MADCEDLEDTFAAAQADYDARVRSAIETVIPFSDGVGKTEVGNPATQPSAARELALEEAAQVAEQFRNKDWIAHDMRTGVFPKQSEPGIAIAAAIRSLAHADAGKVEGDGSRWRIFEAACARGYWGIELEQASNDDEPILYPIKVHRDTLARIVEAHNAGLPSAPASEGAE